mmetsp:Transcript_8008/g.16100  ORF Transcript_8008/g.16100 Transcript_8008/m.16100 type:complete len:213 (-) Transcript_8008:808-1446(-)
MSKRKANDAVRRTWDREVFARRIEERKRAEEEAELERERGLQAPSVNPDDPYAPTRAWLTERRSGPNLEARIGRVDLIAQAHDAKSGFYCAVCKHLAKDSNAFLDHNNSRWHQKNLGMSMRVRRNTKDQVRVKLEELTKKVKKKNDGEERYEGAVAQARTQKDRDDVDYKEHTGAEDDQLQSDKEKIEEDDETILMARELGLPVSFASSHHR